MEGVFLEVLNMSISASWMILAVILIRALTKKVPKGMRYVLWAFVAVRLLCPFSIESAFSLIPSAETVSKESIYSDTLEIHSGVVIVDQAVNSVLSEQLPSDEVESGAHNQVEENGSVEYLPDETVDISNINNANRPAVKNEISIQGIIFYVTWIWSVGLVTMLIYSVISFVRLRKTIEISMQIEDNLWFCDEIQSPFIFGIVRPRIYLPSFIDKEQVPYIVAHEKEHLKYRDHWWKPFGFAILTIHWFNPLVWVAYILLCRDIELACDERVIQSMEEEEKKKYSKSLLICSSPRHIISACPVAFGEIGVKERIKSILNYKKPSTWIIGIGIVACVIIGICFLTNPTDVDIVDSLEGAVKIEVRNGPDTVEITDAETIANISNHINKLTFVRGLPTAGTGGWSYWLKWYDAEGNEIESLVLSGDNRVRDEGYFYTSTNGSFDTDFYDELLENGGQEISDHQDTIGDTESELPEKIETTDDIGTIEISGIPLSETELEWFETEFFNSDETLMPNMFLSSQYDCPENIDLNDLFYGGADGRGGGTISEEEEQLLLDLYYDEGLLDVSRTTASEMNDILQKYMGITLADTNKVHLEGLYYLDQYGAYYNIAGDTEYMRCEILTGWTNNAGNIVLVYKDALSSIETKYQVTLKKVNGNYYFSSNIEMPEDMRVFEAKNASDELIAECETYEDVHVSMLNSESGYILRCSTPAASQMTKVLCKTTDGGNTFDAYLDISSLQNYPFDIYFFTEDIGYIVTDYHGSYNFLYRTEDGGQTWRGQMIYVPVSWYRYVDGISMKDGVLRIQVVTDDEVHYFEYTTDDMGTTWKLR